MISTYWIILPTVLSIVSLYFLLFHVIEERVLHKQWICRNQYCMPGSSKYIHISWIEKHYVVRDSKVFIRLQDESHKWNIVEFQTTTLFQNPDELVFNKNK